jgi:hypothetical protein
MFKPRHLHFAAFNRLELLFTFILLFLFRVWFHLEAQVPSFFFYERLR